MRNFIAKIGFIIVMLLSSNSLPAAEQPASAASAAAENIAAAISGQIVIDDKTPMAQGIILLYNSKSGPPPSLGRYWRVPDHMSPVGDNGMFSLDVAEGTYYLQSARKNPDGEIGPAYEKEYVYFHGDAQGNALPITIKRGEKHSLGRLQAFLWSPDMVQRDKGITAVEGVVVDTDGKPVPRALVLAYYSGTGLGRPVFVSDRTGKDGRFQLRTNDGGTFFLKVRSVAGGGKPSAGEFLNTTKEFQPELVTLKKGEKLKGITLKVMKFSRPLEKEAPVEKREWRVLEK